jgi:phage/plasmid-like protein (TIGR03299 family)
MKTKEERIFDILEKTKTNWTVNKLPLVSAPDNYPTGSYGLFRNDNHTWLGSVKDRYVPMQNHVLLGFLLDAVDMLDLEVTNGGTLNDGKKIYYQIALNDEHVGNSGVKRQLTGLNSHDGTRSIAFGSSNTVVVCQNTFHRAYTELNKVRHYITAYNTVKELAMNLRERIDADNELMTTFKRMADIPLRDEMVERIITKLFKVDNTNERVDDLHHKTKNNIMNFANSLDTEIKLEGKTIWGLFNAVTRYTNHHAAPSDKERKDSYLMIGTGAMLSNLAYDELMQYVDANTREYVMVGL